jgi:hypothetical protein
MAQFAMPHQRLAPDEREVYGVMEPNQFQNARHKSLSAQVAELTKRDATTTKVLVLVRIAAGTVERTLSRDFN